MEHLAYTEDGSAKILFEATLAIRALRMLER